MCQRRLITKEELSRLVPPELVKEKIQQERQNSSCRYYLLSEV